MINFKEVFKSVEFEIPTVPDFEFCDTKDIYFKTPEDHYLAMVKLNKVDSLLFITNGDEVERREFDTTLEIKNGVVHGRVIHWTEWIDYAECEQGVMHGYSESAFQSIFGERGFYKNGKKEKSISVPREETWEWEEFEGEASLPEPEQNTCLSAPAYIPMDYIGLSRQRIDIYRRRRKRPARHKP